ncbi:MAG: hypothetical protein QM703_08425 [Gemmatales bacterium]
MLPTSKITLVQIPKCSEFLQDGLMERPAKPFSESRLYPTMADFA